MKGSSAPKDRKRKGSKATPGAKGKAKSFKTGENTLDNAPTANGEHPLENYVILGMIFDNVSAADLINFRLVDKTWNDVATTSLIKRNAVMLTLDKRFIKGGKPTKKKIPVELVAPEVGPAVPAGSNTKSKKRSLRPTLDSNMAALNACIERSAKFPCTVLQIGSGNWNFEHENMDRFFALCGSKIKVLELHLNFPLSVKTLKALFLKHLPNIECLNSRSVFSSVDEDGSSPSVNLFPTCQGPVYLPWLKVIQVDVVSSKEMFQDLLEAAVNLERIESCSVDMVEALERSGKGSALKGFSFKPRHPPLFDYSLYTRFAALQPNLERLVIYYHEGVRSDENTYPLIMNALAKILKSSSNSLKILDLRSILVISKLELSKFPVLPSLETLYLGKKQRRFSSQNQRIFPPGLMLENVFPNLKKVVFRMPYQKWTWIFPEDSNGVDPIPTVEILVVESDVVDHELSLLYAKFPNTKQLTFTNLNSKHPLNNAVWKTPAQVESIEFAEVRFNMNLMNADSFFTGFHKDTCENLQRLQRDPSTVDIELLEVMPSIRDVKNLKRLKMAFTHRQNSKATTPGYFQKKPFISEITGLFAFSKIPGLDVVFSYDFDVSAAKDIARTFEPLKPYVQFSNEKLKEDKEEDNEDYW